MRGGGWRDDRDLEGSAPAGHLHNKAVGDVQERLQARVMEVAIEVHEDEFQYWPKYDKARRKKSQGPG
jgi:hypothetical protein